MRTDLQQNLIQKSFTGRCSRAIKMQASRKVGSAPIRFYRPTNEI